MSLVSVIIPTYNGGECLLEAVNSALRQTYAPLEIIVVDDGSQEDILRVLSPVSNRINYIRQDNAGPAAARNRGIRAAGGKFIALLDDDDVWHPAKIEAQMRTMSQDAECGLVYSCPVLIDENGSIMLNGGRLAFPPPGFEFPSGLVYYDFLKHNRIGTPSATLIKTEVFSKVGLFDEAKECVSCEDYDMWLRIAKYYKVRFCDNAIVYYRRSTSGISRNVSRHLCSHLYVMDKILTEFVKSDVCHNNDFIKALNIHLHRTYRAFAYSMYCLKSDKIAARNLLYAALRKGRWTPKDCLCLILFSLPGRWLEHIRNMKKKFLVRKDVEYYQ